MRAGLVARAEVDHIRVVGAAEDTRARIVDSAEAVFGDRGYSKSTLEDIAAAAGVSRQLVHRYFGDKNRLFEIVVRRVQDDWHAVLVAEAARPAPTTAHTLRLVIRRAFDFARERTSLYGLYGAETGVVTAEMGTVLAEGMSQLHGLLCQVLEAGIERGDVRADLETELLAEVIREVISTYSLLILRNRPARISSRLAEAVVETLLHGAIVPTGS